MASVSPESPIATCRSAFDAWLDCNDGELAGLLAMDEVSSDANAAFATPNVLRTNKTIKIDFAEYTSSTIGLQYSNRSAPSVDGEFCTVNETRAIRR